MEWCEILYEGRLSTDKFVRAIRTIFVFLVLCAVITSVRLGSSASGAGEAGENTKVETEISAVVSEVAQTSVTQVVFGVPAYISELPELLPTREVTETMKISGETQKESSRTAEMTAPVIPETVLPNVQKPALVEPSVSSPADSVPEVPDIPSHMPSVPEISSPSGGEEVLVPETPSEPTVDEPETEVPVVPVPPETTPAEPETGVINGFLVNESGIIYGVADPEMVVSDGYMELPGEGCTGIAAGTFSAGFPTAREMYIPSNITYIEPGAFTGLTNMEWFEMEPAGGYYTEQGVLFSESGTCILAFPAARTGNYKVPSQVVKFAAGAFNDAQIQVVDAAMCTLTDISSFPENIELMAKETP